MTMAIDADRVAGVISAAEHTRMLGDVHEELERNKWSWDDLAVTVARLGNTVASVLDVDQMPLFADH
jgi:hypothetical protein